MLYLIHLILLAVTVANAVPSPPLHMDDEILQNTIDNDSSANDEDFSKELPYESEYYRTSTDRDEFVRPIPGPEENEIDDGEGGIDLDDTFASNDTPECTYHIFIQQYFESIDRLDIKLDGLQVKSSSKSNLTPDEFTNVAQQKIFEDIKGKSLTNELVNEVITNLRQKFIDTYGYADFCGVSTNVITYFMKNESHDSNHHETYDGITEVPCDTDSSTQIEAENLSTTDSKTTTAAATTGTATTETPTMTTGTATTGIATATTGAVTTGIMTTGTAAGTTGTEFQTELSTIDVTNTDEMDEIATTTTEKYVPKVLKRPKISSVVFDTINFYKALHNWKYSG